MKSLIKILHNNAKIILITVILLQFINNVIAQDPNNPPRNKQKQYSIEQAVSDKAQLNTIAFNGLAFMTGSFGADCFFPPGKVADLYGFQYMRDNDKNEMGHNTDFLTRIAGNILNILTDKQLLEFTELARKQAPLYNEFALKRMTLIKAFRQKLEGKLPEGKTELNKDEVINYCSTLYKIDAEITYDRAVVTGKIINSLSDKQIQEISQLDFNNSETWKDTPEKLDKRKYTHREHVCIMTYASELFSWYAGSVKADVYFCPERHGTYFGGFYLKDYPAMGNHGYNISTSLTGDKGRDFIKILSPAQADILNQIVILQKPVLNKIIDVRRAAATELRKALDNEIPGKDTIYSLIREYGSLDGELSYNYALGYAEIHKTLTAEQKEDMFKLRDLDVIPDGAYLFSDKMNVPGIINTEFLFR